MEAKELIKQKLDLVEMIGEYVPLKPAGAGRFKGLCPFHHEKTPSFTVSQDKQFYYCFGCQEGGDLFDFVMKTEGFSFPEALRILAKRAGVEIPRFEAQETNERQQLVDVNELASKFYAKLLSDRPEAESARQYISRRGIIPELVEQFRLGFAPESWDVLVRFMESRGVPGSVLERAGLALRKKQGSGWVDRFRHRLMIPLCDAHGSVVGFTGRQLSAEADDGPKYMNSPETPVYKKGELLYGFDQAKRAIKQAGAVVIVEGNLDVIASHKAGVANVVASSGTALTEAQLLLLKRLTTSLIFSFDQDAAGFEAARRGMSLARTLEFSLKVALLPDGIKDPDEAVQKNSEIWRAAVAHPIAAMQFLMDRAGRGKDLRLVDDKMAFSKIVLPELALMTDVVEREHWMQVVADTLHMDVGELRKQVTTAVRQHGGTSARSSGAPRLPVRSPEGTKEGPQTPTRPVSVIKPSRVHLAAEALLAIWLVFPDQRVEIFDRMSETQVPEGPHRALYTWLKARYTGVQLPSSPSHTFALLEQTLTMDASDLLPLLRAIALAEDAFGPDATGRRAAQEVNDHLRTLEQADRLGRRKALEADLRQAEARGDRETVQTLLTELNRLT